MADLRARLEALRQTLKEREKKEAPFFQPKHFLEGWERFGEYTFRRIERIPLDPDANLLLDLQDGAKYFLSCSLDQLCWYDTETTGLSGGAGTVIFLFGIAQVSSSGIMVQQFFLSDFPGEAEFLTRLLESIPFSATTRFLSYNGAAYDFPLLKTRYLLHRLSPPSMHQLDLLYLVRRLWKKSLPDCSLPTVERFVLHKERSIDIPGRLIPQVYFQYLRWGALDEIKGVIQHHKDDLLSLVYLFALLGSLMREPMNIEGLDSTALGLMAATRNPIKGWKFLEELAKNGNPVALERVSRRFRTEGKDEEGHRLRTPYIKVFFSVALEELKHLEHVRKDYEAAMELAQFWMNKDLPIPVRVDLCRRLERLRNKISTLKLVGN
ncbi:MAG: ribonuclease H-like domain-containing protein [Spirochaetes bacterium]|nr:ribonuclease H-like domain-containing protein [Spirochaetota bacterium]